MCGLLKWLKLSYDIFDVLFRFFSFFFAFIQRISSFPFLFYIFFFLFIFQYYQPPKSISIEYQLILFGGTASICIYYLTFQSIEFKTVRKLNAIAMTEQMQTTQ